MEIDEERKPQKDKKNGDKKKKQDKKNSEPPKPKPPKTIEGALEIVSLELSTYQAIYLLLLGTGLFLNRKGLIIDHQL